MICCGRSRGWQTAANSSYRAVSTTPRHGEGAWIHVSATELHHEAGLGDEIDLAFSGALLLGFGELRALAGGRDGSWRVIALRADGGGNTTAVGRTRTSTLYIVKQLKEIPCPGHSVDC